MNENIFRILAALIFLISLGISGYFRRKADRDSGEKVSWKDEGIFMILALRIGGREYMKTTGAFLPRFQPRQGS